MSDSWDNDGGGFDTVDGGLVFHIDSDLKPSSGSSHGILESFCNTFQLTVITNLLVSQTMPQPCTNSRDTAPTLPCIAITRALHPIIWRFRGYFRNSLARIIHHLSQATRSGKQLCTIQPGRPGLLLFISPSYIFTSAS